MFIPHFKYRNYSANTEGQIKGPSGKILSPKLSNSGHIYYAINKVNRAGHRFIFECFCGKIPEDKEVNHKDGDKLNNNLTNFELMTHKENMNHARELGLIVVPSGEDNPISVLTNDKVLEIRELVNSGASQSSVAKLFKIHQGTVSAVVLRKTWKHL